MGDEKRWRFSASAIQQFCECRQKYFMERVARRVPPGRSLSWQGYRSG